MNRPLIFQKLKDQTDFFIRLKSIGDNLNDVLVEVNFHAFFTYFCWIFKECAEERMKKYGINMH
jgi:hypothetical protein